MGFPEARKTAKDINTNTNKCSAQLEELLSSLNEKLNLMNSLISSISGGYVSKDYVDSSMPIGSILMWSGSVDTVPEKFHLCNGEEGTPDLRDRFIVGAGGAYGIGDTGGSATAKIDGHTHTVTNTVTRQNTDTNNAWFSYGVAKPVVSSSTKSAGGATIDTIPPYYALCFIMKIA